MKRRTQAKRIADAITHSIIKLAVTAFCMAFLFWMALGSEFTLSYNKTKAVEKFEGLKRIQSAIKVVKNVAEVF